MGALLAIQKGLEAEVARVGAYSGLIAGALFVVSGVYLRSVYRLPAPLVTAFVFLPSVLGGVAGIDLD